MLSRLSLPLLWHCVFLQASSFVLPPSPIICSSAASRRVEGDGIASVVATHAAGWSPRWRDRLTAGATQVQAVAAESASSGGLTSPHASDGLTTPTTRLEESAAPAPLMDAESFSYFRNADKGSNICLVGIEHSVEGYKNFVVRVIREIRPQVVMLELNVERATDTYYLPVGVATEYGDGLWWFTQDEDEDEDASTTDIVVEDADQGDQTPRPRRRFRAMFSKALRAVPRRLDMAAARFAESARDVVHFIRCEPHAWKDTCQQRRERGPNARLPFELSCNECFRVFLMKVVST
ncbi:unnamed protein product [Ectocarpus fasciculatus]